jgi:anti-sigma regulatory factor (Ser/Thr protein kinase)
MAHREDAPVATSAPPGCATSDSGACGQLATFRHEAFLYRGGDDGFLEGTLPLVRQAVEEEAAVLVAVGPERTAALREALGDSAERVRFADMRLLGKNPARIIPAWESFIRGEHRDAPALGIGEPVWPGRGQAELDECERHEALLNVAFDDGPGWHLLCPYDLDGLHDGVIEAARRTHPVLARDGSSGVSGSYDGDSQGAGALAGALPPAVAGTSEMRFTSKDLGRVRRFIREWAEEHSLAVERSEELVLAVNELTTNSIRYGGGAGTLRVWSDGGSLLCEIRDEGVIEAPLVGRVQPTPGAQSGRGMWIANQLCDLVQIRSGPSGTVVRVHARLG